MKKNYQHPKPPFPPVPPTPTPPYPPYPPKPHGKPSNHRARFAPPLLQYHIPHGFKFWCNQTLPFVYDDSLSFYELLNKVVHYLNGMLEDEKLMSTNIGELANAYKELERFVNDYFAYYQSKGLIVFDTPVTNANYREILSDCNTAQMNTIYRLKFVDDSTQNIPANLPEDALPFTEDENLFINISNFVLKFVGGMWQEPPVGEEFPANQSTDLTGNYQLLFTNKNLFFREHSGDTWGEWQSIFGNWWNDTWVAVKKYVDDNDNLVRQEMTALIEQAVEDLTVLITAETNRATARENEIEGNLNSEITRATAAETALGNRITAETSRATAAETALGDRITAETNRATTAETALGDRITAETNRATTAETALGDRITAETNRATAAETTLNQKIEDETDRAQDAEADIRADLNDETTRATAAEAQIATDLATEITRASTAEGALSSGLTSETARAQAAEQAIRDAYIPNAGNALTNLDFTLNRKSMNFRSTNGINVFNTNSATNSPVFSANGQAITSTLGSGAPWLNITNNGNLFTTPMISIGVNGQTWGSQPAIAISDNSFAVKSKQGFVLFAEDISNNAPIVNFSKSGDYSTLLTTVNNTPTANINVKNTNGNPLVNITIDRSALMTALISGNNTGTANDQLIVAWNDSPFTISEQGNNLILQTQGINPTTNETWTAHYLKGTTGARSEISADNEIAVIGDISSALGGSYIPNEGNSKSVGFNLYRTGGIMLHDDTGEIQILGHGSYFKIDTNGVISLMHGVPHYEALRIDTNGTKIAGLSNTSSIEVDDNVNLIAKTITNVNDGAIILQSDNKDSGYFGETVNIIKVENNGSGLTGILPHGYLKPHTIMSLTGATMPTDSVNNFDKQTVEYLINTNIDVGVYDSTSGLTIPSGSNMIFKGVSVNAGIEQTKALNNVSAITLVQNSTSPVIYGYQNIKFENLIFNVVEGNFQHYILNAYTGAEGTVEFENCEFNIRSFLIQNLPENVVVKFNRCKFISPFDVSLYVGEGKVIITNSLFVDTTSISQPRSMTVGGTTGTAIICNNSLDTVTRESGQTGVTIQSFNNNFSAPLS